MERLSVASAGLAHAIAHLGGSQRVCVVTESPEETLATVAGLVRAADLERDRFAIMMSPSLASALPEVLAQVGIDLPAAIDGGRISLAASEPGPLEPHGGGAMFRSCVAALHGTSDRRFAFVDFNLFRSDADPREILALLVALEEVAHGLDVTILSLFDRSTIVPGLVYDAVFCHRFVLTHGVLGENLRSVSPSALVAHRETPLDVDQLLRSLNERCQATPPGDPLQEDAASRRLSEANELLQREIAQRVRMEHILSASEERYRLLVEALPDCVFVHSGGAIVFSNQAGVEMVRGGRLENVLGRSVMSFVHPDSRPAVGARMRMMIEQGLRAPMMTERLLRLDGTDYYGEVIATPLVFEGKPAIQVVVRDITERRKAEAELQFKSFLADNAIDGIIVRSVGDNTILYVNAAMCALTGLNREQMLGAAERGFIAAEEQASIAGHFRAVAQDGQRIFETVVVSRQGTRHPVEVHSVVVRYGEQPVMVSIVRDVSERRHAEAQKRQLSEQLARAQKMEAIGTLASGIAHDFNNILTGVLGYADLIRHQAREGEPLHRAATVIGQAAERGANLAQRILMVARKERMERQSVDLNALVRGAADLLRKSLPGNIELVLGLGEALPSLLADPTQIDQIIMNLATNARDAMPEGGRLTIETAAVSPGELPPGEDGAPRDGCLRLSVSDTGGGIDEETQQRIYDPFFTTKKTGRGTGLGLYIVHTAVNNHGGQIRLSSTPGEGTRISVFLPVTRGPASDREQSQTVPGGSGTILVIDDEPAVREMCQDLLGSLGYRVLTAGDGDEGVRLFREAPNRIDLVILDMVMPNMEGPEVFSHLRRIRADVRVLVCSGYSPDGYSGIDTLVAAGAAGFVQKPFTLLTISTAVKAALTAAAAGSGPPP